MSYDTVKSGIAGRLNALGYVESSQAVDFKNASANEYGNRYILKCLSGENQNNIISLDAAHRAKDIIIKDLDKPSNWTSFVKILKYDSWKVIEIDNYFVLDIRLEILDLYIHG